MKHKKREVIIIKIVSYEGEDTSLEARCYNRNGRPYQNYIYGMVDCLTGEVIDIGYHNKEEIISASKNNYSIINAKKGE